MHEVQSKPGEEGQVFLCFVPIQQHIPGLQPLGDFPGYLLIGARPKDVHHGFGSSFLGTGFDGIVEAKNS